MNKSYKHWESQFLDDMVIKFEFSGNDAIAFKERVLFKNAAKNEGQLSKRLQKEKGFSDYTLRDCWSKKIYGVLKKYGFDYKDKNNPNGKYDKTWEAVRKWLHEEIFPQYIEEIKPETSIELWQELWTQAKNSPNSLKIAPKK